MIAAHFSPISQRLIAAGLALFALLMLTNMVVAPLWNAIGDSRDELTQLRERRAFLMAARGWPDPARRQGDGAALLVRGDRRVVEAELGALVERLADGASVSLSSVNILADGPEGDRNVTVLLTASGPHDAVLAFLSGLERARPLLRPASLSLKPTAAPTGELRVEARYRAIGQPG